MNGVQSAEEPRSLIMEFRRSMCRRHRCTKHRYTIGIPVRIPRCARISRKLLRRELHRRIRDVRNDVSFLRRLSRASAIRIYTLFCYLLALPQGPIDETVRSNRNRKL